MLFCVESGTRRSHLWCDAGAHMHNATQSTVGNTATVRGRVDAASHQEMEKLNKLMR